MQKFVYKILKTLAISTKMGKNYFGFKKTVLNLNKAKLSNIYFE